MCLVISEEDSIKLDFLSLYTKSLDLRFTSESFFTDTNLAFWNPWFSSCINQPNNYLIVGCLPFISQLFPQTKQKYTNDNGQARSY